MPIEAYIDRYNTPATIGHLVRTTVQDVGDQQLTDINFNSITFSRGYGFSTGTVPFICKHPGIYGVSFAVKFPRMTFILDDDALVANIALNDVHVGYSQTNAAGNNDISVSIYEELALNLNDKIKCQLFHTAGGNRHTPTAPEERPRVSITRLGNLI